MTAPVRSPLPRPIALVVLAMATLLLCGGGDVARAQDPVGDFFQGLFGGRPHQKPQQKAPSAAAPRVRRLVPHREFGAPAYWHGQRATKKTKTPKPTIDDPNAPPPFAIAVIGDTLGQQLADGLDEAYADRPDIRILHKGKESSGLVRDDFYDWPKAARELAAGGEKIDAVVVMIGSNDRQAIHEGSETLETLSPRWRERYAARVDAIRAIFRDKKIPLVWVGVPVTKNEHFSADMAKLNDIYRDRALLDSAPFVDIWEAFADERNQYQAFGPDINGRIVKLRSGDGVHFTDVGARKVAHFVEGEIKRIHEAAHQPAAPEAATPAEGAPGQETPAAAATPVIVAPPGVSLPAATPTLPERPDIGPVQSLNAAAVADGDLARPAKPAPADDPRAAAARALVEHIFVEGGDPPSHRGRADDFSWPKKPAEEKAVTQ